MKRFKTHYKEKNKQMQNRLREINERKVEIRSLIELPDSDLSIFKSELETIAIEETELRAKLETISNISISDLKVIEKPTQNIEKKENRNMIETKEYRSAYLRNLMNIELNPEERAMTTANAAVIPTQTLNLVIEKLKQSNVILPHVTQLNIPGNVSIPVTGTRGGANWVGETVDADLAADTITSIELTAHKLIKVIPLSANVHLMSIDAFESFLVAGLVKEMGVAIDQAILTGTGNGQPQGIITAITAIESATASTIVFDDIMTLIASVGSAYAQNAKFVMSRGTLYNKVAKIKDDVKAPIFKMGVDGFTGTISGYPVIVHDGVTANKIIFGDLSAYYLNNASTLEISMDKSAGFASGNILYRSLQLLDGKVANEDAFAVLKQKA
jgi:HK97 family phage major capsid protein